MLAPSLVAVAVLAPLSALHAVRLPARSTRRAALCELGAALFLGASAPACAEDVGPMPMETAPPAEIAPPLAEVAPKPTLTAPTPAMDAPPPAPTEITYTDLVGLLKRCAVNKETCTVSNMEFTSNSGEAGVVTIGGGPRNVVGSESSPAEPPTLTRLPIFTRPVVCAQFRGTTQTATSHPRGSKRAYATRQCRTRSPTKSICATGDSAGIYRAWPRLTSRPDRGACTDVAAASVTD